MARRAGKATSRKARQKRVQRPIGTQPAPAAAPAAPVADTGRAASAPPARPVAVPASSGSRLSTSERSEYHYVERDLRDIGILTAVMAALLLAAWFVFSALGIAG